MSLVLVIASYSILLHSIALARTNAGQSYSVLFVGSFIAGMVAVLAIWIAPTANGRALAIAAAIINGLICASIAGFLLLLAILFMGFQGQAQP